VLGASGNVWHPQGAHKREPTNFSQFAHVRRESFERATLVRPER